MQSFGPKTSKMSLEPVKNEMYNLAIKSIKKLVDETHERERTPFRKDFLEPWIRIFRAVTKYCVDVF